MTTPPYDDPAIRRRLAMRAHLTNQAEKDLRSTLLELDRVRATKVERVTVTAKVPIIAACCVGALLSGLGTYYGSERPQHQDVGRFKGGAICEASVVMHVGYAGILKDIRQETWAPRHDGWCDMADMPRRHTP